MADKKDYYKNAAKDMTGPERNIGPELQRNDVEYNRLVRDMLEEGTSGYGKTKEQITKSFDRNKKAMDKAQAEATAPIGPKFKKGGKVSSASKRADGCCVRGKTRA